MTTEEPIKLELEILAEYTTDDDIFKIAANLYDEINDSRHVESVDRVRSGTVPEGTKAGDPLTIGTLAVAVLPTAIPSLIALVQDWVARGRGGRTIKFKSKDFEFEGSPEDLEKLLAKIEKSKKKKK